MTEQKQEIFDGNFVVGERYMTRSGREATYMGVNPYSKTEFKYVFTCADKEFSTHNKEGLCHKSENHLYNILYYIKPKHRIEGWINIYRHRGISSVYKTKEEAQECGVCRMACVPIAIEYTEGEGL